MDSTLKSKFSSFVKEKGSSGVPDRPADEEAGEQTPEDTESGFFDLASRLCSAMGIEDMDKHSDVASILMDMKDHFQA